MHTLRLASYLTLAIGLILLALASVSTIAPDLIYPSPPKEYTQGKWGRSELLKDYSDLKQKTGEKDQEFLQRLTLAVSNHLIHYWPKDKNYTAISILDNYLLWGLGHTESYKHFQNYEFKSPQAALNGGYGYCSQAARIIVGVLVDTKFSADIYNHANHVVVEVIDPDNSKHVIDADYGVYIPLSLLEMQKSPKLTEQYYAKFPQMQNSLTKIYQEGFTLAARRSAFDKPREFEEKAYIGKWIIALFLILTGCAGALSFKRMKRV